MSPETFKEYRKETEKERLAILLQNVRFLLHELYFESLLDAQDAASLLQATLSINTYAELDAFEHGLATKGIISAFHDEQLDATVTRINELRGDFKRTHDQLQAGQWKDPLREFIESIDARHSDVRQKRLVRSWVSRIVEKAYYLERSNTKMRAEEFGAEVAMVLRSIPSVPDVLEKAGEIIGGKRQPSFIESMELTIDHLKFVERLPETFGSAVDAMIVGGSLNYGPFFNIRANIDASGSSDIDVLFITGSGFTNPEVWSSFIESELFDTQDKNIFLERKRIFERLRFSEADVFSHKFLAPGQDFVISAHFFSPELFERMNGGELKEHLSSRADAVIAMRDYKPKKFEYSECAQRTFDGSIYTYRVPPQEAVEGGYIARLPAYIISNSSFFPGLYQNLISPEFSVFYDGSGKTTGVVREFQQIVLQEIEHMKERSPFAALSLSHFRREVLAPERYP